METPTTTTPAEATALDAYIKLMRAADAVTARAHTVLPKGLTIPQFAVLEVLFHRGSLCQSEIAAKVLKSAGNLTLVVDNLERDGHVTRQRDPEDRRFVTVSLTPQGRAFISELFPQVAAAITREFSALTAAEQTTLAELCKKAGRAAAD
ncbi:MAG TPA: MarR family transcriptional regulator [Opitutaceae bacterium]